jgi:hypothetical protein
VNAALAREVRERANHRCEYCHLTVYFYPLPFHIDHIVPRQHGGSTDADNLALACLHCNRHKGPNLAGRDPIHGTVVSLFHPRHQIWAEHFQWQEADVIGLTATGRATVQVLAMNAPDFKAIRWSLKQEGAWSE